MTRIYAVQSLETPTDIHLVEASSQQQAMSHVVRMKFHAYIPKTKDVATLMKAGMQVEVAGLALTSPTQTLAT